MRTGPGRTDHRRDTTDHRSNRDGRPNNPVGRPGFAVEQSGPNVWTSRARVLLGLRISAMSRIGSYEFRRRICREPIMTAAVNAIAAMASRLNPTARFALVACLQISGTGSCIVQSGFRQHEPEERGNCESREEYVSDDATHAAEIARSGTSTQARSMMQNKRPTAVRAWSPITQ